MEKILDTEHGLPALIASAVVILALHLFMKVGEFVWKFKEKKDQKDEQSLEDLVKTMREMNMKFQAFEISMSEFPKFKTDLNRFFTVLKTVAGSNWASIMNAVLEEEKLRGGK